jgi:hypothetical protein
MISSFFHSDVSIVYRELSGSDGIIWVLLRRRVILKKLMQTMLVLFGFILLLAGCTTGNQPKPAGVVTIPVTYELRENNRAFAKKTIQVPKNKAVVLTGLQKGWSVKAANGFITSIAGKSQNTAKKIYWLYTVNGKMASKGASQQKVQAKDKVVFNLAPTK